MLDFIEILAFTRKRLYTWSQKRFSFNYTHVHCMYSRFRMVWYCMPISWNEKDKEFLLKMGLIWVNVFIGELLWLIFNIMRYSFDTVRVNTQVRGDNISLSTLHGLLVVPRVKDFPKLSSWFNIHLAPVNTPVITDICTCSVTLGFPSILTPVYLLNTHMYLSRHPGQ